ncbi:hypothetical protein BFJ68_g4503 [Fusarium oxysporum]|uniref:Uncharacterized protein n=1 Tax=Fusarium oxysporum TaxID=5507 RepID=A0A420RKT4_FUSOX|nr:hypothetical protein BFJ68_g4503 [Fusarium oxysporum]
MQSSYSDEPQGQCSANKLAVSTYMSTKSMMKLRNGVYDTLHIGSSRTVNQCFEARDMIPTAEDIAELSEFAGDFSTAQYVVVTITSYSDRTGWPQWNARTIITIERAATFDHSGLKRRDATATQQLAARAVYTPGLVQDWDSKKISFACKQIATGTETVTQPVTTTIGVGTATVTATTTVARPGGDVKFYTEDPYQYRYIGAGPVGNTWTAGACSSPSEKSGKCFKIRINGPKCTDGQYLKYNSNDPDSLISGNGGYPSLVLDTWYLSETGRLITQNPYARVGFVAAVRNSNKIIFGTPGSNPNPDGAEAL